MNSVGERFRHLRNKIGLSQSQMAERLNLSDFSRISDIERGKTKPNYELLKAITSAFAVNSDWLIKGEGEMFKGDFPSQSKLSKLQQLLDDQLKQISEAKKELEEDEEFFYFPVMAEIAAGQPVPVGQSEEPLEMMPVSKYLINNRENYVCLRVNGHSMEPEIHHGDVLLIRKDCTWKQAMASVVAIRVNGEITLKRLNIDPQSQMIVLNSTNKSYSPIIVNPNSQEDIQLVGQLSYLFRKY